MHAEEQRRILAYLRDGLANNTSAEVDAIAYVPVEDFLSGELLARERQVFFRETPLLMGLSTDLPESHSWVATEEGGVPILMTRDGDGRFHAFLNACRHRGAKVVAEGRGTQERFACPFHAWTYRDTGELIAISRERKFGEVDKGILGLTPLPCAERHGMLWVRPTPGAPFDADELLGGLGDEMASWQLDDHDYLEEQVIDTATNWKLAIDTFGENYHFNVLHKETLANEIHGNLQTGDAYGRNYRMVFANKPGFQYVEERQMPLEEWPFRYITLSVYFFYPNVILLVDPAGVDLLRIYPHPSDPAQSKTWHRFYLNPAIRERRRAEGDNSPLESRFPPFNEVVVAEDYAVAATSQATAASGAQTHLIFGRNEPALHHYHNTHRAGLGLPPLPRELPR